MSIRWTCISLILFLISCGPQADSQKNMDHKHTNALINESSPYLLQHAHNPVDWYAWSDEAFEKAKAENKLVLISVGYSACHWCHVMEHETFEDSTAAAFMNEHFVNIKVDREERPDVDQVYMNAVQLMTQRGGWPLNCFALPDGRPVYGGTYFPKEEWMKVLQSLVDIQKNDPEKMEEYAAQLTTGVQQSELITRVTDANALDPTLMDDMVTKWSRYWDRTEGGPNRAPKFPLPSNYEFLMHYGALSNDEDVLGYVRTTLDKMAQGGIYDQIGGGFARYSVDGIWKVPHFEKMLYDNAQLVSLYSEASIAYKEIHYEEIVHQTLEFIQRELTNEEGLFYSALDADSEGEEGKFYVWKESELKEILGDDFPLAASYYNVNRSGLWEHGNYILLRDRNPMAYAEEEGMMLPDLMESIERINSKLMAARDERVRPGLDDKILTSWNAMMIRGYVDAAMAFSNESYLEQAKKSMETLLARVRRDDGGLLHSYKNGKAKINGYLEDYCFTIEALIRLYESTFDVKWLERASELSNYCIEHFHDEESGMFWFTSDLDPKLIARKQEVNDNVIPASNSSMAKGLFQLGLLMDNKQFTSIAEQMLRNISGLFDYGQSYSNWGMLYLWSTRPFHEVAITGPEWNELHREWNQRFRPNALLCGGMEENIPLLQGKVTDKATIYVCVNKSCQLPVHTVSDALDQFVK